MRNASGSLLDLVTEYGESNVVRVRWKASDELVHYTGRGLADAVEPRAAELVSRGIGSGDRVAIFGTNSGQWLAEAFAAWRVGAIVVPAYPTSSARQVEHILRDSGAALCLADTEQRRELARSSNTLPDEAIVPLAYPGTSTSTAGVGDGICGRPASGDAIATVIYTSGTTGTPKGCVLTHRNILAAADGVNEVLAAAVRKSAVERAATQLLLPLSHSYGLAAAVAFLAADVEMSLAADPAQLIAEMAEFRPTILMAVPRLLEKIRNVAGGSAPDLVAKEMLGGRLRYVVSGGASTDRSTVDYFASLGVEVLGAYGLTETAAAVSMSEPGATRRGSVGRAIPGTTITIGADGEISVQGPQVSPGYWPLAANGSMIDGPLFTGDLGRLDDDGFLYITGRSREILVTSGGKNVAPALLEDRIRLHPLVSNCMLIGDNRPFVAALITLDEAALVAWPDGWEMSVGAERDSVYDEICTAIAAANELVSRAEGVRAFRIVDGDFSVERGHLTPSLKLRRAAIERDFAADVAAIYADIEQT